MSIERVIEAATAPLSTSEVGVLVVVQLLTELIGDLRPGDEGGEVLGRGREILDEWLMLGRLIHAPGTPFDAGAAPALAEARAMLDRAAPLMARIRRTPTLPLPETV